MRLSVKLRSWALEDAKFIVKVRNTPSLQQWFKQDSDLTVSEQVGFMTMTAPKIGYYGFIVEVSGQPIGFTSLIVDDQKGAEFGIGILPRYQGHGYTLEAVNQTLGVAFNEFCLNRVYGDVFVHNPALSFYLWKCGFKAVGVTKDKYHKKAAGSVSVVDIEQRK